MQCNPSFPSTSHITSDNKQNEIEINFKLNETTNDILNRCDYDPLSVNSLRKESYQKRSYKTTKLNDNYNLNLLQENNLPRDNKASLNLEKINNLAEKNKLIFHSIPSFDSTRCCEQDKLKNIVLPSTSNETPILHHSMSMENNLLRNLCDQSIDKERKAIVSTTSLNQTLASTKQYLNKSEKSFTNLPSTSSALDNFRPLSCEPSTSTGSINTSMIVNVSTPVLHDGKKFYDSSILTSSPAPLTSKSVCLSLREQTLEKNLRQNFRVRSAISNTVNFECDRDYNSKKLTNHLLKSCDNVEQSNHLAGNDSGSVLNCKSNRRNALNNRYKSNNGRPSVSYSPTTNGYVDYDSKNRQNHQPFDLEDVLLLQHPILPPNSHFFCCFYKFHITVIFFFFSLRYNVISFLNN